MMTVSGRRYVPAGVFTLAVMLAGLVLPEYYVSTLNYIALFAIVGVGLVLLTGVAGIISFGQAAFVGLGAYATAVLTSKVGLSPWMGLLAAISVTIPIALILGALTLKLSGYYLPLGTMCWGVSLYYIFGNLDILGAQEGLSGIPPISIGTFDFDTNRKCYYLIWITLLLCMALTANIIRSRVGRALLCLKTSEAAATSFGIPVFRMKLYAFLYAALLGAISGWLYAHLLRFVDPSPFSIVIGMEYVFVIVIGGSGQVWGALAGAVAIILLRDVLQRVVPLFLEQTGNFEIIAFGALAIILLQIARDRGVSGAFAWLGATKSNDTPEESLSLPKKAYSYVSDVVDVKGISKRFGGLRALDNVSFKVGPAEIVAVIGPNGAGKTTLFNVISGAFRPDGGTVEACGQRIDRIPSSRIVSSGLARTYQHVHLVPELTVLENVMIGAHSRTRRGMLAAGFGLMQSEEEAMRWEAYQQLVKLKLSSFWNLPATSLSLGQQRLVEIARALVANPRLVLLDEPAAGLRYGEKQVLAQLLQTLKQDGISILLVEHDMTFVMDAADRIVVMNFGEKLTEGKPTEVRADPEVRAAYLGGSAT